MLVRQTDKTGKYLLDAGVITEDDLTDALRQQEQSGGRLGSVLLERGAISQGTLIDVLAKRLGVKVKDLIDF